MSDQFNFETYLFLEKKQFIVTVINKITYETIYKEEMIFEIYETKLRFDLLKEFLEKNIFKIEKLIKNFVKDIYIILNTDDFFKIGLSIKKKNNFNIIDENELLHPLSDL